MKEKETEKELSAGFTASEPEAFQSVPAREENFQKKQKENLPDMAGKKAYKK